MKKAELECECNTIKHYHHTNGISEGTLAYELLVGLCDPFLFSCIHRLKTEPW